MADELAPVAAPDADAPESPAPDTESLADHQSVFGPPDPSLEGDAKAKNDEARAKVRHRAKSQAATPDDVGRIGELTKKLRATEAERDALKATRPPSPPTAPLPLPPVAARSAPVGPERGDSGRPQPVTPTRPKPSEEAIGTTYATYADFVEDLADWKGEQRDAAREAKQQQEAQARQQTDAEQGWLQAHATFAERRTAFVKDHADYDAVIAPYATVTLPPAAHRAILTADNGPAMVYHLAQHPDQLAEAVLLFDGKPPSDEFVAHATRWLSSRMQAASTGSAAPAPPINFAARPPNPVRTGPSRTDSDLPGDDNMSLADHEKAYGRRQRR